MSYSLAAQCPNCTKVQTCSDRHFIAGAIQGIHQMPINEDHGHQGAGTITLDCSHYEAEPDH